MKFTISSPRRVAAGGPLQTPLVVTLTASSEEASKWSHLSNLMGLWMYVSLMSADGTLCLAPPHEDLLRGKRAESIHAHQSKDNNQKTTGSASFSDITITKPGRYRFRISIVDMTRGGLSDPEGEGKILPALYSDTFDVVDLREVEEQDLVVNEVHLDLEGIGVVIGRTGP